LTERQYPFIAREGIAFLSLSILLAGTGWHFGGLPYALPPALLFVWLFLIFRDPHRDIPAAPLGVVSPVDGVVTEVDLSDRGIVDGEVHKITIRINSFGTYTARSPVEGKIMDLLKPDLPQYPAALDTRGLWLRTDEDEDIVLQFHGHRFGIAPRALLGFGQRVGQGQRCAYLRLTAYAEVQLPLTSRVLVTVGQRVSAGSDLLAKLRHH
jgi:phosphatidylserine decarboxylase